MARRAARGELDPVGGAAPARRLPHRRDAAGDHAGRHAPDHDEPWLGWDSTEHLGDVVIVTAWTPIRDEAGKYNTPPKGAAAAFLLPTQVNWEYPKHAGVLSMAPVNRGVAYRNCCLPVAARPGRSRGGPLLVVVGTAMRGTQGGEPRQHLEVWRLPGVAGIRAPIARPTTTTRRTAGRRLEALEAHFEYSATPRSTCATSAKTAPRSSCAAMTARPCRCSAGKRSWCGVAARSARRSPTWSRVPAPRASSCRLRARHARHPRAPALRRRRPRKSEGGGPCRAAARDPPGIDVTRTWGHPRPTRATTGATAPTIVDRRQAVGADQARARRPRPASNCPPRVLSARRSRAERGLGRSPAHGIREPRRRRSPVKLACAARAGAERLPRRVLARARLARGRVPARAGLLGCHLPRLRGRGGRAGGDDAHVPRARAGEHPRSGRGAVAW